jgi:tetratricopeptide (TPR) repeat protein
MDWLDGLSKEATQEAAAGEVADPDGWLSSLGQPEEVSAPEPPPEGPAEPTPTPSEEEGLAWLEGLASKQGIAEEELVTSPEERSEESPDWLQPTEEESLGGIQPVQTEKPALDQESMDWLENLSKEAVQEADLGEVVDTTDEWLDALSDLEEEIEAEVEPATEKETPEDIDDLLQSLIQPEQEEAETIPPDTELPVEETPVVPVAEEQPDFEPEADTETPMVPDWLQDSAEQKTEPAIIDEPPESIPEVEEPVAEAGVTPTLAEEWQPEAEAETPAPPPPKPAPPRKKPADTEKLDAARQDISIGNLEEAVKTYNKLVKRGKMVEEIIMDIQEALRKHPVDVGLWQTLGDAYTRTDRLQDALDSYSKAEDLLR